MSAEPLPCRCDGCKYGQQPGSGVVLYAGPDAVALMEESAIRDERYADLDADWEAVIERYQTGFSVAEHHVRRALAHPWRAWQRELAARGLVS